MTTTVDLPDLNVWLALACPDHSHHRQALHYWEQQAAEQVLFCTVTALGLVRLVCQPKLMGAAVRLLGLSLVIGATDWAQRDLLVAAPKLSAALITWLACFWIVVQRRRQRLPGAAFARASLYVAIPAVVALYLSLPASR